MDTYYYDDIAFPAPGYDMVLLKEIKVEGNSLIVKAGEQEQPLCYGKVVSIADNLQEEWDVEGLVAMFDKSISAPLKHGEDFFWLVRPKSVFGWTCLDSDAEPHDDESKKPVKLHLPTG